MAKLNKSQILNFIRQCRVLQSIDFPNVANGLGYNWNKDIKPHLDVPWFRDEMENFLESIKYSLVSRLHEAATRKPIPGAAPPPAAHIKEMIKLIDSGILLGAKSETPEEEGMSAEEEKAYKKRLGLDVDKKAQDN